MTNDKLLDELKKEIADLKREVRESRQFTPQPYPVYVPQYPYYPPFYQPCPYPWWQTITTRVNYVPTNTTTAIPFGSTVNYCLNSGSEVDIGSCL